MQYRNSTPPSSFLAWSPAALAIALGGVLAACGGGGAADTTCHGAEPSDTATCSLYPGGVRLIVSAVTGDGLPAVVAPGVYDCSTSINNGRGLAYPEMTGDFPFECLWPWRFEVVIAEGQPEGELEPTFVSFADSPIGIIQLTISLGEGDCTFASTEFWPTGAGTIRLSLPESCQETSCGHVTLDQVEFEDKDQPGRTFLFSGELRLRDAPLEPC
jgi:hypothetical protein